MKVCLQINNGKVACWFITSCCCIYICQVSYTSTQFIIILVAGDPTLTSLDQIRPDTVRVTWSPPSGGATVTGYVVHYRNTTTVLTKRVPLSSTSTFLTGLTSGPTYIISVEATSKHLSGESGVMIISLSELTYSNVEY